MIFSNFNYNCFDLLDLKNLQEQVKKAFCYQKLFWPFTVWINCSSDLKIFENSRSSASNSKSFSRSLEQFSLRVGQNNFGNKIPFLSIFQKNNENILPGMVLYAKIMSPLLWSMAWKVKGPSTFEFAPSRPWKKKI